jgi:hypothetical protein
VRNALASHFVPFTPVQHLAKTTQDSLQKSISTKQSKTKQDFNTIENGMKVVDAIAGS